MVSSAPWVFRRPRCSSVRAMHGSAGARHSAGTIFTRVVCLSRFLIRPGVRCRNLASHVLGLALRRLPMDFAEHHGYRPWLVETFVAPEFEGTCFKAANFVRVGYTAGRGRQDIGKKRAKSVKSVYMFALEPNWRRRLNVPFVDAAPSLEPGEGLDSGEWAGHEFGGAPLGDQRLSARLVKSVDMLASIPGQPITGNPEGDRAAVKGYYRMIDQPEESAVTPENILAPHRARTVQRMRDQNTVLCIQDGTDLNFATRPACGGLEIIGRNQTSAKTRGLHLHLTLATTGEGLPLGILRCGFDPPKASGAGSEAKHANATQPGLEPRAGKDAKTQRWIQGLQDAGRVARELTGKTRVIGVMDREADFYELFDEQRRIGRVEVLVRARHNRILGKRRPETVCGIAQSASRRPGRDRDRPPDGAPQIQPQGSPARAQQAARTGRGRFRRFDLPSTIPGTQPVPMSVVHLRETNPRTARNRSNGSSSPASPSTTSMPPSRSSDSISDAGGSKTCSGCSSPGARSKTPPSVPRAACSAPPPSMPSSHGASCS